MNSQPPKNFTHTVSAPEVGRVDRVVQAMTGQTRSHIRRLIQHGLVRVNEEPVGHDFDRVAAGDVVSVSFDPHNVPREKAGPWKDPAFSVVFEDEHIIVVDKRAGVLTVPTGPAMPDAKTLEGRINDYLRRTGRGQVQRREFDEKGVVVVHRLDQGTSGLLVFAKHAAAAALLKAQFAEHKPLRIYRAIVRGLVQINKGSFRTYLATGDDLTRYSTTDADRGELAITHYQVVRRYEALEATLVECRLETGRRNQIRVHFSEVGHPVLGDPRYQSRLAKHPKWRAKRIALHAATLGLDHPVTGKLMLFESPMPDAFTRFLNSAGQTGPGPTPRGT
jgi:23S rRNA pseudouridine1911/1915/1917 synthase